MEVFGDGGYKAEWRDWPRRTRTYFRCILNDPKVEEQLSKIEAQRTECSPEQIRDLAWPDAHSILLQTQLALNLRGDPELKVAAVADKHGYEQWRVLAQGCDPTSNEGNLAAGNALRSPPKAAGYSDLTAKINEWLADEKRHRATGASSG